MSNIIYPGDVELVEEELWRVDRSDGVIARCNDLVYSLGCGFEYLSVGSHGNTHLGYLIILCLFCVFLCRGSRVGTRCRPSVVAR